MTIEIATDIEINSTPERVWKVLTEFENYHKWNPFIKSILGFEQMNKALKKECENEK